MITLVIMKRPVPDSISEPYGSRFIRDTKGYYSCEELISICKNGSMAIAFPENNLTLEGQVMFAEAIEGCTDITLFTQSPTILSYVRHQEVYEYDEDTQSVVPHWCFNLYGKNPGSILKSSLGIGRPIKIEDAMEELFSLIDSNELQKAKQVLDSLKKVLGDPYDEDIMRADAKISFKERRLTSNH